MKPKADWFGWSLQFIFGLFVGALAGLGILSRRRSGWWLAPEHVSTFIWGAALIGAGLASFYGDRLWLVSSYRVIPPEGIVHSNTSRILSILTGVLGAVFVFCAILRHLGIF